MSTSLVKNGKGKFTNRRNRDLDRNLRDGKGAFDKHICATIAVRKRIIITIVRTHVREKYMAAILIYTDKGFTAVYTQTN